MTASTKYSNISISKKAKIVVSLCVMILSYWSVIILYPLKCLLRPLSMDMLEQTEVIKLYNKNIGSY